MRVFRKRCVQALGTLSPAPVAAPLFVPVVKITFNLSYPSLTRFEDQHARRTIKAAV